MTLPTKSALAVTKQGATASAERARLRAELDGLVAQLYGLTESEFAYILTTFPLVAQPVKDAALEAYRAFRAKIRRSTVGRRHRQGRERDAGVQIFRALGFQAGPGQQSDGAGHREDRRRVPEPAKAEHCSSAWTTTAKS